MSGPSKKKGPVFDPLATKEAEQTLKPKAKASAAGEYVTEEPTPEPLHASKASGKAKGKKKDDKPKVDAKGNGEEAEAKARADMADMELIKPPFECYFDDVKGNYYLKAKRRWVKATEAAVRLDLRRAGYSGANKPGTLVSDHDKMLRYIMENCCVDYAGPISGRSAGFHEMCGREFLIKDSPKLPQPRAGEFETIKKYLQELFGLGNDPAWEIQCAAFELWTARAWRAIADQKLLRGHAIFFAGPAQCGKNFIQDDIITPILGGRLVKAGKYLRGGDFNGNLFGGEHLMMQDEESKTDYRERVAFGGRIKGIVANINQEMHYKNRESMSAQPIWRLTISLNDEVEFLEMLPPITHADLCDKVHLFKCYRAAIPDSDEDQFFAWKCSIAAELPAWLDHCLNEEVPPELGADGRMGTRAFQNPELLERIHSLSRESHLLALIDRLLPWESEDLAVPAIKEFPCRASDLRKALQDAAGDNKTLANEIANTIRDDAKCGQYLTRLSELEATKGRVIKIEERTGERRGGYIIKPPVKEGKGAP